MTSALLPLLGGVLIGVSSVTLWVFNGRIAGISGILGGLLRPASGETPWRLAFLGGLLGMGALLFALQPGLFGTAPTLGSGPVLTVAAGLLVGFGTRLGNGCTSGHGICGMGRGSRRSIFATVTFMATAVLTVFVLRTLTVGGA